MASPDSLIEGFCSLDPWDSAIQGLQLL